ncbi:MAG: Hsp20/alpha crystallin family protein [Pseudomonadota bacterium]
MDTDKQGQEAAQNAPTGYQGASMQQPEQGQEVAQGSMEGHSGAMNQAQPSASMERRQESASREGILMPPVDVIEDAGGITLVADMPGVSKDNLNLRLEAHSLTIEGALSMALPPDMQSRYAEVRSQRYERTFALSRELDGEQATAQLAHGVLKVRIPKAQHAVPRKIPVNVA